ncbi:MAG: hypothetical protein KDD03_01605 [Gelidibacter sp.]|nr:hypothetical protein [Gelidibacter sp.]
MSYKWTYLIVVLGVSVCAQNKQILYDFTDIPQALIQNPGAKINYERHFGVPLFSQVHFNAGSSGANVYDIFSDDGRDINVKIRDAIFSMTNNDYVVVNQQLEIINGGWRKNETTYYSYGLYEELDVIGYFPKDVAVLAWEGNANYINESFSLSDVNFKGELISVIHFGINKEVNKKLTFGVRGKLYSSIFNVHSTNNRGTFTTRLSNTGNNYYEHVLQNLDGTIKTSGLASLLEDENSDPSKDIKKIIPRLFFSGNFGLGVDLGFTIQPNDQTKITASMLDFGAIFHSKDVENYNLNGSYTFEGIGLVFPPLLNNEGTTPYWENFEQELDENVKVDTLTNNYVTWRSTKFNASYKYSFGEKGGNDCNCLNTSDDDYQNAVGVQLFSIFRPKRPQIAATAYYYRRLFDALRLKLTYTVDDYSFSNVGLGMSMHFGKVNLYGMVDNLLQMQNISKAQSVSLQLGINLIFDTND